MTVPAIFLKKLHGEFICLICSEVIANLGVSGADSDLVAG